MQRFIDRGAIVAGWVGIGMAITIAMSFLLIIPIEPIYWYLALPAGLLIGYYANARSGRAGGPWRRIVGNAAYAGAVTGLSYAAFLLVVKLIFFNADSGYPTFNRVDEDGNPVGPTCQTGADCVYQRYLAAGQGPAFEEHGITDLGTFTAFYWDQQLSTARLVFSLALGGSLIGGVAYGFTNRRRPAEAAAAPGVSAPTGA